MAMLKYDSFYRYEEWTELLEQIQAEHPSFVRLISLARTKQGKQLWLAEVNDPSTGPAEAKAAYYVQAGLHAIEGAGVTAALHILHSLLTADGYRGLLKRVAFYIVPCVDPDGTDYALLAQIDIRNRYEPAFRKNELMPQDINGDGYVLQMRWRDPLGLYKEHPDEPRLMIRREPGDEGGIFYHLAQEGLIRDYDGTLPASPRRVDFNRSYPVEWKPSAVTSAFPFSEPEMRAIAEFQVSHPNIFAGVDFHCGTHAVLRTSYKTDQQFHPGDLRTTLQIGKLAEEITGFPLLSTDHYNFGGTPARLNGNSNNWAYAKLGISHYVIEVGFGLTSIGLQPSEILRSDDKEREEYTRRLLAFHDERGSRIFMPWRTYDHPQLGEVEVGGMMVGNARFMYPPDMAEVVPKTTGFVLKHASMGPRLIVANAEAVPLGARLFRIRATIGNIGALSTDVMQEGGSPDMKRPVTVKLVAEGIGILNRSGVHQTDSLAPAGGSLAVEWFVRAEESRHTVIIEASHPRAGTVRCDVLLKDI
ncbi:MAG: peptidase [Paenibacillus sp.]|jgi:hypothetical protein|nr:peptidase [Paenibacillus sp.]